MPIELKRGETALPADTEIYFFIDNVKTDPESVLFTVFDLTDPPNETVVGVPNHPAFRLETGHWYARFDIPMDAVFGDYKVLFSYVIVENGNPVQKAIEVPFSVVSDVVEVSVGPRTLDLLCKLRVKLRDNNPDAYYRFAPPVATGRIMGFTKERGYIWQDDELLKFLEIGLSGIQNFWWGSSVTSLEGLLTKFDAMILALAAQEATNAEAIRWISEEFQYDINGVSLSIDRSSKFQSMADAFGNQVTSLAEGAENNAKGTKAVKSQYGVSRGAALGPRVGGAPVLNFIRGGRRR